MAFIDPWDLDYVDLLTRNVKFHFNNEKRNVAWSMPKGFANNIDKLYPEKTGGGNRKIPIASKSLQWPRYRPAVSYHASWGCNCSRTHPFRTFRPNCNFKLYPATMQEKCMGVIGKKNCQAFVLLSQAFREQGVMGRCAKNNVVNMLRFVLSDIVIKIVKVNPRNSRG